jgi:hypothetical protein
MRHASPLSPPSSLTFTQAFEKVRVDRSTEWRLTEEAVCNGVLPTARFRHSPTNKLKRDTPNLNPNRQASGAKGGRASAARVMKNRLKLPACSLLHHYTPDLEAGYNTISEAGTLGSLLPAYPHTDFGALFCTDQAYPFGPSATFSQPGTLVDQWGWPREAEIGFAAYDGLFAQLSYQGGEGVIMPY